MSRRAAVDAAIGKAAGRDANGRFAAGSDHRYRQGRKRGSRNRISAEFWTDLCDAWEQHGPAVLSLAAYRDPVGFLRVAASLMPAHIPVTPTEDIDPDRFAEMIRQADAVIDRERRAGVRPAVSVAPVGPTMPAIEPEHPKARRARLKREQLEEQSAAINRKG